MLNGTDKKFRVKSGLEPMTFHTSKARCPHSKRLGHDLKGVPTLKTAKKL